MARTEVHKSRNYTSTYQPGFANLHTEKHYKGTFWIRDAGGVLVELPPRHAYRLYKFLKKHYETK